MQDSFNEYTTGVSRGVDIMRFVSETPQVSEQFRLSLPRLGWQQAS